ncbi:uncharacterized protein LOC125674536 isoform X2 [Ostrea edulis]|uniref:uncharacterized protein LOC125674536 isoform X2 n=1 Tax=Ostrea edulis TaxID=37623 RepID=UPI0024AF5D9B|nr:uncharacterized protein LOC125674536 isoform X2 [Ostrea edulis]
MSGRGEMLFLLILLHIFRCHYFVEIHSIDKDKFIFIGNQIVGDMFIVKDIIPKRGQLKIRCSSECLSDVECGGFRIFLNATTCSLLGGKFQAVMESSSIARFYQRATALNNTSVSSSNREKMTSNSILVPSSTTVTDTSVQTLSSNTESMSSTVTPVTRTALLSSTPTRGSLSLTGDLTPTTASLSSTGDLTPTTASLSSTGDLTPTTASLTSAGDPTPTTASLSSAGDPTPTTASLSSAGDPTPTTASPSSAGDPTTASLSSVGDPTSASLSSAGDPTPTTASLSSAGDPTPTTASLSSAGDQTPTTASLTSAGDPTSTTASLSSTMVQTTATDIFGTTILSTCTHCECIEDVYNASGVYDLAVKGTPITVYCEIKVGHSWTVIFRRTRGDVTFNRNWTEYENGFGNVGGDLWLDDAFSYHDGMKFSTKDHDNDLSLYTNCASHYGEPWWSRNCARMKFTRDNFNDLGWGNWYMGNYKQLVKITMMIRKPVVIDTSGCADCDCVGALTSESRVYRITVRGNPTDVYCEMRNGYNWMVIFRRTIGDVAFNNMWTTYENGFGNLNGDHWLGLKDISYFTSSGWDCLRVEMEDVDSYIGYAQYSTFEVGDASTEYRLSISGYSGTAGYDAFTYHNNMKFSTRDRDNDLSATKNCASLYGEPWWNNDCSRMMFTRDNFRELGWYNWYTGNYKQLVKITMSIRKSG